MQEIDVSKVITIPSDTEIPVHDNHILTKRPLCTEFPENSTILDRTEAIKIITDISEDLNKSEETCLTNLPVHIEELLAIFDPLKVIECDSDLFKEGKYTTCNSLDELKKLLSELLIKFDTNPEYYIKEDYLYLISVLYKSLIHLYEITPINVIIHEWDEVPRDDRVPSEKLIVDKIEDLIEDIGSDIYATNEKLDTEISNRKSEISRVDESISDINDLIPSEATSSNLLADKLFVNDLIATNASNFRGDWSNWTAVPSDPLYYPEDYTGNKKPNNNDYLIIQNATDYDPPNTGIWRFVYKGDWNTNGKSGWNPQYRVGSAFTQAQQDAIDSGITSTKVSTYDGYATSIGALQTDKVDKIYTADKVYGTNNQGSLIAYTAGNNISFINGQINAADLIQSDWSQSNNSAKDFIKNKPTNLSSFTDDLGSSPIHTHNLYLTLHLDISGKEDKSNKVTSISSSSTDVLYPSAKCVYDEFATTVTSLEILTVLDFDLEITSHIPVVDKTSETANSFAIDPNKMYMFGTRTSLTVTLNPGNSDIVNEYMFQFTSGSVATTLNIPSSVTWLKDPDIQTGKKYAVSIENNLGIIGEWSNE